MADPTGPNSPTGSPEPKMARIEDGQVTAVPHVSDESAIAPKPTTAVCQKQIPKYIVRRRLSAQRSAQSARKLKGDALTATRPNSRIAMGIVPSLELPSGSDAQSPEDTTVDEYPVESISVEQRLEGLEEIMVKMYINKGCKSGPMLDREKIRELHDYNTRIYYQQMTLVVQDLIYCAKDPKEVFDVITNEGPDVLGTKVSINDGPVILSKTIPIHPSRESAFHWLRDLLESIDCCPFLFSPTPLVLLCKSCRSTGEPDMIMPPPTERVAKYRNEFDMLKKHGARLWTCDEVSEEFRKHLGDEAAQMILDHNIDASLLPHCQAELLREQMNVSHSTALKMAAVALNLRAAAFESIPENDQKSIEEVWK